MRQRLGRIVKLALQGFLAASAGEPWGAYCSGPVKYEPFALSLSKGFDRLSPNGNLDFLGPKQ